ncbi:fatty acyl-AMP ligase [Micromonospora craniellae]|uniref:Fatty acyl-AMP ligase n=1 Tax=Micromonospora craniellae TaxID=2294034 RepID=A0A372FVI7_9ACTN|nr:fatty acyl-AMP ligase [Micromonospora craniellae]QOC89750.1 fatty acyl-AMP ligase [Micromonospora craniellae]RFS44530.1 fatty acyl-AMP ligase [Micromonospora craniellae]
MTSFSARMAVNVEQFGERTAFTYVADPMRDDAPVSYSYAQIHDAARRVGALLQDRLDAGDRAMLLYPPGPQLALAVLGCLYSGVIPIVVPVPDGQQHRSQRLTAIVRNARAAALLTEERVAGDVTTWAEAAGVGDLPRLVTDATALPDVGQFRALPDDPDLIAFLQYTSGSTSQPRGVVVTHGNLADNAEVYQRILGAPSDARHGGWLPMHHDFGLIGLFLSPLYVGSTTVHMPASVFLRHPQSWLFLVDRFDVQISPAPNFAYEMCLNRIAEEKLAGLDLSRWLVAVNGAEPVQASTLTRFRDRFAPYGLRPEAIGPGYGLAEATLAVSCAGQYRLPRITRVDAEHLGRGQARPVGPDADEATRDLVGCGTTSEMDIRIVDSERHVLLPDGEVGEIWLRGPSVARGYWENPEATAAVFDAVTACGERGFLRTGDLGVRLDDELYISGRIKELLIIRGRNLYPQDLEAEARTVHPALALGVGAAFSVPVPEEQVVLVHEVRAGRATPEELARISAAVRHRLSREFGVEASVLLVRPGGVARTTSGKIQRVAVRRAFQEGSLAGTYADLTPEVRAHLDASDRDRELAGVAR